MSNISFFSTIAILIILPVLIALSFSEKKERVSETTIPFSYATKWQRAFNWVIDFFFSTIRVAAIYALIARLYPHEMYAQKYLLIILVSVNWPYYFVSEYFFQKTIGKAITQTKLVSDNGAKPGLEQILYRTMARGIPFEFVSYLFMPAGLHDKLSSTIVIKTKTDDK